MTSVHNVETVVMKQHYVGNQLDYEHEVSLVPIADKINKVIVNCIEGIQKLVTNLHD